MEIKYLCDVPEYVKDVSKFIYNEFVVTTSSTSSLEKVEKSFSNTKKDNPRITFVAIVDDKCVGTISIFENDLKTQDELTPWLAALYVEPEYRGKSIAKELIKKVIDKTKELGYKAVYLRTEHTAEYYRKLGWEFVRKAVDEKGIDTEVYRYNLD